MSLPVSSAAFQVSSDSLAWFATANQFACIYSMVPPLYHNDTVYFPHSSSGLRKLELKMAEETYK